MDDLLKEKYDQLLVAKDIIGVYGVESFKFVKFLDNTYRFS